MSSTGLERTMQWLRFSDEWVWGYVDSTSSRAPDPCCELPLTCCMHLGCRNSLLICASVLTVCLLCMKPRHDYVCSLDSVYVLAQTGEFVESAGRVTRTTLAGEKPVEREQCCEFPPLLFELELLFHLVNPELHSCSVCAIPRHLLCFCRIWAK